MNWIDKFKQDENKALEELYNSYRDEFANWSYQKFKLDEEAAIEIFQVSIVIIYDNVMKGKLTELTSGIKTYLFAIGKNKIMEQKRRSQKNVGEESIPTLSDHIAEDEDQMEHKYDIVASVMRALGDPCKSLLQMFYYQQLKLDEITTKLGYKNTDTAKNQKYKCMKRLQKMVKEHKGLKLV